MWVGIHRQGKRFEVLEAKLMNDELMYEHWLIKMVHASQFLMISIPNNQCKSPRSVTSIYFFMFDLNLVIIMINVATIMQSSTWTTTMIRPPSEVYLKKMAWLTSQWVNLRWPTTILTNFWYQQQPLCFKPYRVLTSWQTQLGCSL